MSELLETKVDLGDGETVTIKFKSLNLLPLGLLRTTRDDEQEQVWRTLEWAVAPECLPMVDELPASKLMTIILQMQEESQANLGKSENSSPSSTSTETPSKPTSSTEVSD
ncbi:tail assembly chaperone [Mycobacterium phage LilSpotty]|uniref:Tail assembly chaperone n=1 Tax=Mycobacterium phage LilSpotty TaxID=2588512 RepID=A0A4Y6ENV2_9CAUD|nr:tail assembly chaperone [Mycobacterium phage LilSpotty]QDF19745.1 tail assembly chaperone [Mycobacterium phage LilSpotty]